MNTSESVLFEQNEEGIRKYKDVENLTVEDINPLSGKIKSLIAQMDDILKDCALLKDSCDQFLDMIKNMPPDREYPKPTKVYSDDDDYLIYPGESEFFRQAILAGGISNVQSCSLWSSICKKPKTLLKHLTKGNNPNDSDGDYNAEHRSDHP